MKLIEEVIDLILFKNNNDWHKMEDFEDLLMADKLLTLRKVQASLKALITLKALTTLKLLWSKYWDIEEQYKAKEENENIITLILAIREPL